jgi:osmotically-inducible protein OsmY
MRRRVEDVMTTGGVWASPLTVDMTVVDGVVRLRGQVRRRSFVAVLARMAEAVDGVVRVDCELGWDVDDTVPTPVTPMRPGP